MQIIIQNRFELCILATEIRRKFKLFNSIPY